MMGGAEHFNNWIASVFLPYIAYFFAKNIIENDRQIHILLAVLLGLSIYYNITSLAEKFRLTWIMYPRYMVIPHEVFPERSCGPIRNPGIFGNAIGMVLPIHLYFLAITKNKYFKAALLLSMTMGFAAIYFTYTRGSWLASLAGLFAVAFFNRKSYLKTLAPLALLGSLAAILILGIGQDEVMQKRVENEQTIGARVGTQITAMRVWRDYPIFGCGSFDYARVRGLYIDTIEVPLLGTIRFRDFRENSAHDMYFGPLAEDGLVGMTLTMSIYFVVIINIFKKHRLNKIGNKFAIYIIPLLAGISANYLVGGLTISYRNTTVLGTLFFIAAAIVDRYEPQEQVDEVVAEQTDETVSYGRI